MFKHIMYSCSLCLILVLAGCNCPFCSHQEPTTITAQEQSKPQPTKASAAPLAITSKDQFEKDVIQSQQPVVIDFSAEWCGACKASKPTFDAAADQLGASYKFATVDVDKVEAIARELGIQGIPTFIFFKNGKEVNRITGAITKKEEFIATIEKTFGK